MGRGGLVGHGPFGAWWGVILGSQLRAGAVTFHYLLSGDGHEGLMEEIGYMVQLWAVGEAQERRSGDGDRRVEQEESRHLVVPITATKTQ